MQFISGRNTVEEEHERRKKRKKSRRRRGRKERRILRKNNKNNSSSYNSSILTYIRGKNIARLVPNLFKKYVITISDQDEPASLRGMTSRILPVIQLHRPATCKERTQAKKPVITLIISVYITLNSPLPRTRWVPVMHHHSKFHTCLT